MSVHLSASDEGLQASIGPMPSSISNALGVLDQPRRASIRLQYTEVLGHYLIDMRDARAVFAIIALFRRLQPQFSFVEIQ